MLLKLQNVSKKLDGKQIIPPMNLEIIGGKIIGLLGPNGSGKTTLLKLISGLSHPTTGKLYLNDSPYHYPKTANVINFLPDTTFFPDGYSVQDAVEFYHNNFADFSLEKVQTIINDLQIPIHTKIQNMSKGQQERLTLALVLSRKAQITILDEPLAAIDVTTRDAILQLIHKYLDRDSTIMISTHLIFDMQDFFDEVIFLNNGQITLYQNRQMLLQESQLSLLDYYRSYFSQKGGF